MKKVIHLFLLLSVLLLCVSCDMIAPIEDKMVAYYSNTAEYDTMEGTVYELQKWDSRGYLLEIEITMPQEHMYDKFSHVEGCTRFFLPGEPDFISRLLAGTQITFITALGSFYNGQDYPLVAIELDDEILLDFETGKENYLTWIKDSFW